MRIAFASIPLLLLATPVVAQQAASEADETYVEIGGSERLVEVPPAPVPPGIASYGPFRVLDANHAALVDVTDAKSLQAFTAMLHDYPRIAVLEMIECPGTDDDRANLLLGREIHAHAIATYVPQGGSVRSGAVELFLAGTRHSAALDAEFAVHAWADDSGRQPGDFAADSPENRAYLDYYREMGMTAQQAQAFYAMTNSVPNADAKWLSTAQLAHWVKLDDLASAQP